MNPKFELWLYDKSASHESGQPIIIKSDSPLPRFEVGDELDPHGWWPYADTGNVHRIYRVEHMITFSEGVPTFTTIVHSEFDAYYKPKTGLSDLLGP